MATTVEELQSQLAAAGRNPDAVQWADDPQRVAQDGVYVLRRSADGVSSAHVSRGRESFVEHYDSEAAAVAALHERLLTEHPVRDRSEAERARSISRMQAKAAAERERRRRPDER